MIYYIFNTEQEAVTAEQQIINNVRQWVVANVPDALSEDGTKLRGRNAATGQLVDVFTIRWAIPQQINDGRWVFPKPTTEKTSPIPVEIFIENVSSSEEEFNNSWWSNNIE